MNIYKYKYYFVFTKKDYFFLFFFNFIFLRKPPYSKSILMIIFVGKIIDASQKSAEKTYNCVLFSMIFSQLNFWN